MKQYDVLVAGEINPDLILSGQNLAFGFGQQEKLIENLTLTTGSSSVIFACGAARLGLKVGFIGVVGDDLFGRFMLDAMRAQQVDVTQVITDPAHGTGMSVILSQGVDRAILAYPGAIDALRAEQISDDLLKRARHLHIASYFLQTRLQAGLPDLFHRAHALGLTTSLDTNWDPAEQWNGLDDLLTLVDIFLPNENEALAITGSDTTGAALERLGQITQTVVIKQGARGAIARDRAETVSAEAITVPVIDTVGAGDTFDAGFIFGFLNQWSLEKSLRLACVCGVLSTQAAGGTAGQPSLAQATEYMARE